MAFPKKVKDYVVWLMRVWREITVKKYSQMVSLSIEEVPLSLGSVADFQLKGLYAFEEGTPRGLLGGPTR